MSRRRYYGGDKMSSIYREFKCRVCGEKTTNPCDKDIGICRYCGDEYFSEVE